MIENKIRKKHLKWYVHTRFINLVIGQGEIISINGGRGRRKLKKTKNKNLNRALTLYNGKVRLGFKLWK